ATPQRLVIGSHTPLWQPCCAVAGVHWPSMGGTPGMGWPLAALLTHWPPVQKAPAPQALSVVHPTQVPVWMSHTGPAWPTQSAALVQRVHSPEGAQYGSAWAGHAVAT